MSAMPNYSQPKYPRSGDEKLQERPYKDTSRTFLFIFGTPYLNFNDIWASHNLPSCLNTPILPPATPKRNILAA